MYAPAANPVAVAAVPPDGDHEYVYGEVPPVADTVAEPLLPPLHAIFIWDCVALSTEVVVKLISDP